MYRVLFLFDYRDLHWRMVEAIAELRHRIPEMALVSDARLERAWMRRHLDRYHFMIFRPEQDMELIPLLDQAFLEAPLLHRFMYRMFSVALLPTSHPCLYTPAHLRTVRTSVTLEFVVENNPDIAPAQGS